MAFGYGHGFGYGYRSLSSVVPPIVADSIEYLLQSAILNDDNFNYIENAAADTDGKLINSDGTAYEPYPITSAEYPQDGTIDLSNGRLIDTQSVLPSSEEQLIMLSKDVVINGVYTLVSIHYKGNDTADVYYANDVSEFSLLSENTGLNYTPPTSNYIIESQLEIPMIPSCIISTIDDVVGTSTVTLNITFNTKPLGFALGDISLSTPANGTLENLVEIGWNGNNYEYTLDFVPATDISDTNNTIVISGELGEYTDRWLNASVMDTLSNTFEMDTVPTPAYNYRLAFDEEDPVNDVASPSGITINHAIWGSEFRGGITLLADDGTDTGVVIDTDSTSIAGYGSDGIQSGDNSFDVSDTQLAHYWTVNAEFDLFITGLNAGTYTVKIAHSRDVDPDGSSRIGIDTVNGVTYDNIQCYSDIEPTITVFTDVVIDGTTTQIDILLNKDEPNGGALNLFNSIDIIRTA